MDFLCSHKNLINLDTPKNCCNYPKIGTVWFYYGIACSKDVDRMANSVDLDQNALRGSMTFRLKAFRLKDILPKRDSSKRHFVE